KVDSRSPAAQEPCISFRTVRMAVSPVHRTRWPLLFSSSCINKYRSDDQAPVIYPRLTPHSILTLANYAFPTSFSFLRLLTDLQGDSVYRNNIYVPVLPEKRSDRIVPGPFVELN